MSQSSYETLRLRRMRCSLVLIFSFLAAPAVSQSSSAILVARNGRRDATDAMRGVAVGPLDRLGRAVVEADVTHEFSSQVFDGGEDASGDDVALDLGEPDLDLIEPRRVGGSEVKLDIRVIGEELLDTSRFVSGEVIQNDVDLFTSGLACDDGRQERYELSAGVAIDGLGQAPRRCGY